MYKVFFKDRLIFLGDKNECPDFDGMVYAWTVDVDLTGLILQFDTDLDQKQLLIVAEDIDQLFAHFRSCFKYIEAAGGMVFNGNNEILCIYRLDKWDLPKGKIEKDESITEAAMREVEEECGISGVKVKSELNSTYHTYWLGEQMILKKTYWFKMIYSGNEILIPQKEEDIQKVEWISEFDLDEFKSNTYASILDVLEN